MSIRCISTDSAIRRRPTSNIYILSQHWPAVVDVDAAVAATSDTKQFTRVGNISSIFMSNGTQNNQSINQSVSTSTTSSSRYRSRDVGALCRMEASSARLNRLLKSSKMKYIAITASSLQFCIFTDFWLFFNMVHVIKQRDYLFSTSYKTTYS